jgi:N-acetylmuramoyl-L-alanine amidase
MNIQWVDGIPNFYSRNGVKPFVICNHISAGTIGSMTNWFKNPKAQASSHFGVGRDGTILQYVKLENGAWTQGILVENIFKATAQVVKDMKMNPNYYCVGIEHEGYVQGHLDEKGEVVVENYGLDGVLTDAQFAATCWLHRYIMDYLNNAYGVNMSLSEYNVVGHYQIDPVRKPNCPGINFPWAKLRAELAIAQTMTLAEYEMRQQLQIERPARVKRAMEATNRIIALYNKSKDPADKYTDVALDKMDQLYGFLKEKNLLNA